MGISTLLCACNQTIHPDPVTSSDHISLPTNCCLFVYSRCQGSVLHPVCAALCGKQACHAFVGKCQYQMSQLMDARTVRDKRQDGILHQSIPSFIEDDLIIITFCPSRLILALFISFLLFVCLQSSASICSWMVATDSMQCLCGKRSKYVMFCIDLKV